MRALLQRVSRASVSVEGKTVGETGPGLLLLLCVTPDDTQADIEWLAGKCTRLRIFDDAEGVMNLSVCDTGGGILCISQFTLAASTRKGNRPSYIGAARPETAQPLYEAFCRRLEELTGRTVGRGVFGAHMEVSLVNDGPVTIMIDSRNPE